MSHVAIQQCDVRHVASYCKTKLYRGKRRRNYVADVTSGRAPGMAARPAAGRSRLAATPRGRLRPMDQLLGAPPQPRAPPQGRGRHHGRGECFAGLSDHMAAHRRRQPMVVLGCLCRQRRPHLLLSGRKDAAARGARRLHRPRPLARRRPPTGEPHRWARHRPAVGPGGAHGRPRDTGREPERRRRGAVVLVGPARGAWHDGL